MNIFLLLSYFSESSVSSSIPFNAIILLSVTVFLLERGSPRTSQGKRKMAPQNSKSSVARYAVVHPWIDVSPPLPTPHVIKSTARNLRRVSKIGPLRLAGCAQLFATPFGSRALGIRHHLPTTSLFTSPASQTCPRVPLICSDSHFGFLAQK